jgi:hypothetical protein
MPEEAIGVENMLPPASFQIFFCKIIYGNVDFCLLSYFLSFANCILCDVLEHVVYHNNASNCILLLILEGFIFS